MTTLKLDMPFLDVTGLPTSRTLAGVLSELIATETEGKTLKLYGWHRTLLTGGDLVLDDSDLADLRALVDGNKRYLVFAKGQLLEALK